VISYRVMPGVPAELVLYVAKLLLARRRKIGTPCGSRALSCWKQAVFALAWFRDRPDVARLGHGFGISQATAYRYLSRCGSPASCRAAFMTSPPPASICCRCCSLTSRTCRSWPIPATKAQATAFTSR
jgi:hypothetical protein